MAITAEASSYVETTASPERCRNRKATITVSVTAVDASKATAKREARRRAKALKDSEIADMKRDIHCPDADDICPSQFVCYEDPPWRYPNVNPGWSITPDDEDTPTEWTAVRTYDLTASLRCECIRGTLAAKAAKERPEEDELEELLLG